MSACWQKPKRKCKTNLNKLGIILFTHIFFNHEVHREDKVMDFSKGVFIFGPLRVLRGECENRILMSSQSLRCNRFTGEVEDQKI